MQVEHDICLALNWWIFWCEVLFSSYGMICSPMSTFAGILDLSEDKTVYGILLSNLKVWSDLQDSVATQQAHPTG